MKDKIAMSIMLGIILSLIGIIVVAALPNKEGSAAETNDSNPIQTDDRMLPNHIDANNSTITDEQPNKENTEPNEEET